MPAFAHLAGLLLLAPALIRAAAIPAPPPPRPAPPPDVLKALEGLRPGLFLDHLLGALHSIVPAPRPGPPPPPRPPAAAPPPPPHPPAPAAYVLGGRDGSDDDDGAATDDTTPGAGPVFGMSARRVLAAAVPDADAGPERRAVADIGLAVGIEIVGDGAVARKRTLYPEEALHPVPVAAPGHAPAEDVARVQRRQEAAPDLDAGADVDGHAPVSINAREGV